MRRLAVALAVVAFIVALPASSSAQLYLVPNIGWDFGGSAGKCPSIFTDCSDKRVSYGVTFGGLVSGILGLEEDIAYAPDFFGDTAGFGTNDVLTAMTNLVIAIPAGPVRPFVEGGVGLIRTRLELLGAPFATASVSHNSFGYNFGGGVMFFFPAHLGVRGDIRYFRSATDISILGIALRNEKINFTRVSVGLVIH